MAVAPTIFSPPFFAYGLLNKRKIIKNGNRHVNVFDEKIERPFCLRMLARCGWRSDS